MAPSKRQRASCLLDFKNSGCAFRSSSDSDEELEVFRTGSLLGVPGSRVGGYDRRVGSSRYEVGGWVPSGAARNRLEGGEMLWAARIQAKGALWLSVLGGFLQGTEGMLLVPLQTLSTSMAIIVSLILFLFTVPVICKIIHIVRVQVRQHDTHPQLSSHLATRF